MSINVTTYSHRRAARLVAGLVLAAALAGCSSGEWGFPYRASIQQGNWITQEQVALLQKGMTREQVRFALGSPTLTSALHANRWDYPYFFKPGYGKAQERTFTVWFENEQLDRWNGDEQPELQPFQEAKQDLQRSTKENAEADLDQKRKAADTPARARKPGIELNQANQTAPGVPVSPGSGAEPLR